MKTLTLGEKFVLSIMIKKDDCAKVEKMLIDNKIIYSLCGTCFRGFVVLECSCNVRRAEIIRVLLKNIKVYD